MGTPIYIPNDNYDKYLNERDNKIVRERKLQQRKDEILRRFLVLEYAEDRRERERKLPDNDKWITLPNGRRVLIATWKKELESEHSKNVIPENIPSPLTNHQNKMIEKVSQVQNETWKPHYWVEGGIKKKRFKDKVGLLNWRSNLEKSKAIDNDRGARD